MWPFKTLPKQVYESVASDEEELKDLNGTTQEPVVRQRSHRKFWILIGVALALLVLLLFAASFASGAIDPGSYHIPGFSSSNETKPEDSATDRCPRRQEWRTLSTIEQSDYVTAVLCLRDQPSTLLPNSNRTSYDDFPWIHSHVGYKTHNSAEFLPWHRYFLHIYERRLREQCDYKGSLTYWDWTMDADELEDSPVFDSEHGFGGDGKADGEITVGRTGRCVVDGPFANVTAEYYDVEYKPHCLSRGFRDFDGKLGHMDGHDITYESIQEVLDLDDYESFVTVMEMKVHDTIPFGIAGDFETFTAPYDPLFFLHHTQLDRLWWEWQRRQPNNGTNSYGGHKERHSIEMASLDDVIEMRGLAPNIKVADVMDMQGDLLCYRY